MNVRMILMLALSCPASVLQAQTLARPKVVASNLLIYPVPARSLGISGVVLVSVVTDGSKPVAVDCLSGPPTLVESSLAFVKSWRFVPHKHTKFTVELTYKLVEPSSEEENPENSPTQETLTLFLPARATIQSTIIPNGCAGIEVIVPPKKVASPFSGGLTLRSSRTPPALPSVPSQHFAISAPLVASVQAGPLSSIR